MTDTRRDLRAPIALKIKYKTASVDEFAERYAADISRGGVFIKSKSPLDVGTLLKFELQLSDETGLIAGVGRVVWIRKLEDAYEDHPAGMGIKFVKMDGQSRSFVEDLVNKRGDGLGRFDAGSADVTPETGIRLPAGEVEPLAPEDRSDLRNTSELLASAIAEAGVGGETASEAMAHGEKAYRKSQEVTGQFSTEAPASGGAQVTEASAEPKKRGAALPVTVVAAVLLLGGGGAFLLLGDDPPGDDTSALVAEAAEAERPPVEATPAALLDQPELDPEPEPEPEILPPYRLTVVTDPEGATVTVGGETLTSPGELTFEERPSSVDVSVLLAGHRPIYQRLRPSAYEETERGNFEARLELTLKPRSNPAPVEAAAAPRPAPQPKREATPAPEPAPKAEPEPAPKAEPKPEPEQKPTPAPEPKADPDA